jgi:hypothetical protein
MIVLNVRIEGRLRFLKQFEYIRSKKMKSYSKLFNFGTKSKSTWIFILIT